MRQLKLAVIVFLFNYLNVNARICENIHVLFSGKNLESSLRGCTAVIGYIEINLIETNITEIEFPELTTITGYLLLYRISGLTSVAKLFPNLSIIGGDVLMTDYALVLYDLPHLEEIGLASLRYIGRGAIRIEHCPKLCFVDTIDWNDIAGQQNVLHYFDTNFEDCPECPLLCKGNCWNQSKCQKQNFQNCGTECLLCGHSKQCELCKNFNHKGICVSECPEDKYAYLSLHTCVTKDECVSIGDKRWFIFNNQCIETCPEEYEKIKKTETQCQFCGNNCTQFCSGGHVDNIQRANDYYRCTHVIGSLEIDVSITATVEALSYGLRNIRVIDGYLKISDSSGLVSLNFLKNLKVISGKTLYQQRYSLVVFNNKNLRQLWNWDDSNLKLERGIISFHYNPKLCHSEIDNLIKYSRINRTITKYDVCPLSNGEKTSCTVIHADVNVQTYDTQATITWNPHLDAVGYIFYYREDNYENASINEIEKECFDPSEPGWFSHYSIESKATLLNLHAYTRYVFYIQTSTLTSYFAAGTDIYRFRTKPGKPLPLTDVEIIYTGTNDLEVSWIPPKYPGGTITHYEISLHLLDDELELTKNPDYCHFPSNFTRDINMFSGNSLKKCYNDRIWNEQIQSGLNVTNEQVFSNGSVLAVVDNSTTSYIISGLMHYRMYVIHIRICNSLPSCSSSTEIYNRTRPSDDADDIESGVTISKVKNTIYAKWAAPKDPNSYIASYIVQYKNIDNKHSLTKVECVTVHDYAKNQGHVITNLPSGNYELTVTAISLYGPGYTNQSILFNITVSRSSNMNLGYYIFFGFIAGVCFTFAYYCYLKKRKSLEIAVKCDEQLNRSDLLLSCEDSLPVYGVIKNGLIKSQNRPCTVKFASKHKNLLETAEFLKDVNRMKFVKNAYHVISLIGLVFPEDPPIIVMELMAWGDLKSYLIEFQNSGNITEECVIRMAAEIADGMLYLSSQHLTHPDLAARNCMVTAGCTIKIAIFGINKDIYPGDYYDHKSQGRVPIRWMAPESIADGIITINSNVWSYGIVLWEIITGAPQPYEILSNEEVVRFVLGQRTLERPTRCSDLLYYIMSNCWKWKSTNRTDFLSILEILGRYVGHDFDLVSFYESDDGVEYRTAFKEKLKIIDKNVSVRWKVKNQAVTLDTIVESIQEDLNLPSVSSHL